MRRSVSMRSASLSLLLCLSSLAPLTLSAAVPPELQALLDARSAKALPAAEALVKADANSGEAWIALTRARVYAKQYEKAVAAGEKATALAPKNAQAFLWLGNAYGNRIGEVGMLSKMTMAPDLRDAFETAVKLDPSLVDARIALLEYYLQAPSVVGGGVDKAKAQAAAIGKYDRVEGLVAQARVAMEEKNAPQAIKFCESALALKPNDARLRMQLIALYQEAKRWPDAYAMLKKWAAEQPQNAMSYYQMGRLAAVSGQYLAEGESGLRKYLGMPHGKDEPEPKHVYYRLGQVLAKAGRKDEAKAALQTALKLDPKMKEAQEALGTL